jgi:hypothetical protein
VNAAYSQAPAMVYHARPGPGRKAIQILNAWSPMLWDFEGNDAKLLAAWTGAPSYNPAENRARHRCRGRPQQIDEFRLMLLIVYVPLLRDFFPEANGNWDPAIADTMVSIAIFCDARALFDSLRPRCSTAPKTAA